MTKLLHGWPFLVGRTVRHSGRVLLVPEPLAHTALTGLLADLAGPAEGRSSADTWAFTAKDLPQSPILLMRSFQVLRPDDSGQLLYDRHSRPIRLFEGLMVPGVEGLAVLGEDVWRQIRAGSVRQYGRMLAQEQDPALGRAEAAASTSLRLRSLTTLYASETDPVISPSAPDPSGTGAGTGRGGGGGTGRGGGSGMGGSGGGMSAGGGTGGGTDNYGTAQPFSLRALGRSLFAGNREPATPTTDVASDQVVHLLELATSPPPHKPPALPR